MKKQVFQDVMVELKELDKWVAQGRKEAMDEIQKNLFSKSGMKKKVE